VSHLLPGSGKIVYDPHRGDMKNRTQGWCIVEVDREITRYYRWWLQYEKHIHLKQPAWDAHISVVRGEKLRPEFQHLWKKYQGKHVNFTYDHSYIRCEPDPKQGGFFYWIDVDCPELSAMREEMGLPVGWRFHITVGRTYV
jgi:hypothetical protein